MSYDIYIRQKLGGVTVMLSEPHDFKGGTYAVGGTHEAHLNVTYNYGKIIREWLHPEGISWLYGQKITDTILPLAKAMSGLKDNISEDYWEATEGNVKKALFNLMVLAIKVLAEGHLDAVWDGD